MEAIDVDRKVEPVADGDPDARVETRDAFARRRARDVTGRVDARICREDAAAVAHHSRVGREVEERLVAERLDELGLHGERPLPSNVGAVRGGDRQMLGPDPDHELASGGSGKTRAMPREVGGKRKLLRPERQDEPIRRPRDRRLVQIHRRRADERGDEQVRGALVELLRRRQLLQSAPTEDRDPIAHRHRLRLIVRDVESRDSKTTLDTENLAAHLHAQARVEVRERLVHEEHCRLAHERPAHGNALALAAGELAGLAQNDLGEPQHLGHLVRLLLALVLRDSSHPKGEGDVLEHVQVRIQRVVLKDHRDVPLLGREVVDHLAVEANRPRRRFLEAGDHPERRRLATARRTDQNHELALVDEEVERVHSLRAVVEDLGHLLERQSRHSRLLAL